MSAFWRKSTARRWVLPLSLVVATLAGCGGGGGDTEPAPTAPLASGVVKTKVTTLTAADVGAEGLQPANDGGATLTSSSSKTAGLAVGDVVHVAPGSSPGLPVGFTGKVIATRSASGVTTVDLMPASIEDIFEEVSWEMDTSKTGVEAIATVDPQAPQRMAKRGESELGLVFSNGKISGSLKLTREFQYSGQTFKVSADVQVSDIVVRSSADFNPRKIRSNGGWGKIGATVTGKIAGTAKISSPNNITIPIGDALYDSGAWKDLKWNAGSIFAMEGLRGSDKAGRIPLGGIVIVPAAGAATAFSGASGKAINNRATLKALATASAIVFWVYTDSSGNISFKGEAGVKADGGTFSFGREYELGGSTTSSPDEGAPSLSKVTVIGNGTLKGMQRMGLSAAADVLIGGIRPLSVNGFAGFKVDGKVSGDGFSLELFPDLGSTAARWACADATFWAGIEAEAAFRIKASLSSRWIPVNRISTTVEHKEPWKWTHIKKAMFAGHNAVCDGAVLSRSTLSMGIGQVRTIAVVDAAGDPLLDFKAQKLALPSRLTWTAANPTLVSITPGPDGAVVRGTAAGTTDIIVADKVTRWTKKIAVTVGAPFDITISDASCVLDPASPNPEYPSYKVSITGTAKGPVGSYISAASVPNEGMREGDRVTSCAAWTATYRDHMLYCQRGPVDPEETTYIGAHTVSSFTSDEITEAFAILLQTGGPDPKATAPMTCR